MKKLNLVLALVLLVPLLVGCTTPEAEVIEKVVTQVVTEKVIETVVVEGTPQVVEREVTRVVEVEKVVEPTAAPAEPKILRVGANLDQYTLDPDNPTQTTVAGHYNNANVFDNLTRLDENYELAPWLATSWEYDMERGVWIFQLRDDVYYHDGVKFTAETAAEYINFLSTGSTRATLMQIEEGAASAPDELTLEIKSDNLSLPGVLAHNTLGIRRGDPFAGEHIGTGPFIFVEYVPQDHITVTKNPDYWAGEVMVDGMEMRFMPDPITRLLALQAGEVDVIFNPPVGAMASALQEREDITVYGTIPATWLLLNIVQNGAEPYTILQDITVREALGYAIDRQALADTAWGGYADTGQTWVAAPLLGEYADLVEGYTYDPEKAMALLEEAGWTDSDEDGIRDKDGRRLNLRVIHQYPASSENGQVPQILKEQLKQVGVDLEIVTLSDYASMFGYFSSKEMDMVLENWTNGTPSPCYIMRYVFYYSDNPNSWQSWVSPVIIGYDEILEELDNCTNSVEYADAQMWAAETAHTVVDESRVSIPLLATYQFWASGPRVKAMTPHPVFGFVRWELIELGD